MRTCHFFTRCCLRNNCVHFVKVSGSGRFVGLIFWVRKGRIPEIVQTWFLWDAHSFENLSSFFWCYVSAICFWRIHTIQTKKIKLVWFCDFTIFVAFRKTVTYCFWQFWLDFVMPLKHFLSHLVQLKNTRVVQQVTTQIAVAQTGLFTEYTILATF